MVKSIRLVSFILLFFSLFAATAHAGDTLIVHGDRFYFSVAEPSQWRGYTEDTHKYRLNAYFSLPGYNFDTSPAVMYIRVLAKSDNSVEQSLASDMRDFALRKRSLVFSDLAVEGLSYRYAAKQYLIDNRDVDYLCYVDPGEEWPAYVIFVLSGPTGVSPGYLGDFQALVRSFQWGGEATVQR
ncbi:MAG: hypothetical protein P4N59_25575 [Negativicutes bacterium]|nr:hypothetical protein [Negativicutes bacterium]